MAKQSARSKGYRKYHHEVKGYTEQEKKTMIIGFAVIAIILVLVLVVPKIVESFTLLKVKDGVVQDVGENWLLANVSQTSEEKYRKMAEVGEIEGFELTSTEPGIADENLQYFVYAPTDPAAPVQTLNVQSGNGEAAELSETFRSQMGNFGEMLYQSEAVEEAEINGMKTYTVVIEYRNEDYEQVSAKAEAQAAADEATANEEEIPEDVAAVLAEETRYDYSQSVVLYIDSNLDGKCVLINAMNTGDSEAVFQDADAIHEIVRTAAASITLE